MTRAQLEHLIRAAADIADDTAIADRETLLQRLATVEVETEIREAAHAAVLRAFQEAAEAARP